MAGDWIKMRSDLFSHPKIVRIASALKADNLRTIGGLMSAWCLFDAHSIDGRLSGYTLQTLDDHVRWTGFSAALLAVGWLECGSDDDGEFLELPRFDAHNGQSAKRRAQDADRKREDRKTSAPDVDKKRTREEKRREEKKEQEHAQPPVALSAASGSKRPAGTFARFEEFWELYPIRKGKADALRTWVTKNLDAEADSIIADVRKRTAQDRQWLDGYAPHGSTYVNARGWDDDIEVRKTAHTTVAQIGGSRVAGKVL